MKANDELYFQLKVKRELWEKFKTKVPSNITLNDAVLVLIEEKVKK